MYVHILNFTWFQYRSEYGYYWIASQIKISQLTILLDSQWYLLLRTDQKRNSKVEVDRHVKCYVDECLLKCNIIFYQHLFIYLLNKQKLMIHNRQRGRKRHRRSLEQLWPAKELLKITLDSHWSGKSLVATSSRTISEIDNINMYRDSNLEFQFGSFAK